MNIYRSAIPDDFEAWKEIYKKYLAFYKTMLTEQQLKTLWSWFFNEDKQLYCHLALQQHKIVGLAHFREYIRPIKAATAVFLDDLYVENELRGQGIARSLIQSVNDFCTNKKIPLIRWITAHDNIDAMRLYDKIATQTQWRIYDMVVK